jgi:hypothetical protein
MIRATFKNKMCFSVFMLNLKIGNVPIFVLKFLFRQVLSNSKHLMIFKTFFYCIELSVESIL